MKSTSENDPAQFNLQLRRYADIECCAGLFRSFIEPYGFDTFAAGELDLQRKERYAFYVIAWPEDWRRFYLGQNLMVRDPVVSALDIYREPFSWSDLLAEHKLPREALAVIELARSRGWTEGLVIPIPRSSAARFGLVSLAGKGLPLRADAKATLSLVSICFFDYVRSLVPKCGFAAPPAGLTAREMDCIRLVAEGKPDREIADVLQIAVATAHEYVESAKRKLKASTRAEMVGIAASLAIISP